MKTKSYYFNQLVNNYDKKRIPLSSTERAKRKGEYRYFGAQGVIDYIDEYIFDGEYLLIAEDGENLKSHKQSIAQLVTGKFWVNNHAHIVQGNELCSTRYLYYLINSLDISCFNIPRITVQKKVAEFLANFDDKIELNAKINENLEKQIESILIAFISEKETIHVKLGDYLYIKGRIGWKGLKKNEYLPCSNYRIINGESLTTSGIDWNKAGYITEERYEESPEIMLNVGDILLSKDGTIGKIGYVDSLELPTSVASGIFVIRNNKPAIISTTFIYFLLRSNLFNNFIIARTEGSVIPHLYQKDFMEFEFPLPYPNKMNEFEAITVPMFSQIIENLNENKTLSTLRDVLLPKLISGELDVSNLSL